MEQNNEGFWTLRIISQAKKKRKQTKNIWGCWVGGICLCIYLFIYFWGWCAWERKPKTFKQHFSSPHVFKRKEGWLTQHKYQSQGTRQRSCILKEEGGLWSPSILLSPQVSAGLNYGCHRRQWCIHLRFHWSVSFFRGIAELISSSGPRTSLIQCHPSRTEIYDSINVSHFFCFHITM